VTIYLGYLPNMNIYNVQSYLSDTVIHYSGLRIYTYIVYNIKLKRISWDLGVQIIADILLK